MYMFVKLFIALGFNGIWCKFSEDGDCNETCKS